MTDAMKRALNSALMALGLLGVGLGVLQESAVEPIVGGLMALVGAVFEYRRRKA